MTQNFLTEWLDEGAEAKEFLMWMRGGGSLVGVFGNDDPYYQILRHLPECGDKQESIGAALAERAAEFLDRQPDADIRVLLVDPAPDAVIPPERQVMLNERLYNLILLSAGLESPDRLREPLVAMQQRGKIDGTMWNGISLKRMLDMAVAANSPAPVVSTELRPGGMD